MDTIKARATTISLALLFVARAVLSQCGTERWPVKVGTDADIGSVNPAFVTSTSIAYLQSLTAPRPLPENGRSAPVETSVYSINATLVGFELESDSDYHLVLADEAGRTMIAEIPSPSCSSGSAVGQAIAAARATFDARYRAASTYQTAGVPVEIRGIGFFDFLHGQRGVAPNGIELHPVLEINFSPAVRAAAPPKPPWHRAAAPSTPRPACSLPTLTFAASKASACPGEPIVLMWQSSDAKATVTVDGVGSGLLSSGSATVGATYSLAYSGHASNACGTGPEAVSVVAVQGGASGGISAPAVIQQGASTTVSLTISNAASWSVSSALGNTVSPTSGTGSGTIAVSYYAAHSGTDTLTLSMNGSCGITVRSATMSVTTSVPQPPPPVGYLRCCDGTLSPTCTNCASKQGCCSHHSGVCGC